MELKEVIKVLSKLQESAEYYINEKDMQALQTAISHLETLQKVKEAGGVKRKGVYENNYSNGWNDCLDAVHAELAGNLEGMEDLLERENFRWDNQSDFDKTKGLNKKEWFAKAIRELFLGKKEE